MLAFMPEQVSCQRQASLAAYPDKARAIKLNRLAEGGESQPWGSIGATFGEVLLLHGNTRPILEGSNGPTHLPLEHCNGCRTFKVFLQLLSGACVCECVIHDRGMHLFKKSSSVCILEPKLQPHSSRACWRSGLV